MDMYRLRPIELIEAVAQVNRVVSYPFLKTGISENRLRLVSQVIIAETTTSLLLVVQEVCQM